MSFLGGCGDPAEAFRSTLDPPRVRAAAVAWPVGGLLQVLVTAPSLHLDLMEPDWDSSFVGFI